jgi:hypothetical protein
MVRPKWEASPAALRGSPDLWCQLARLLTISSLEIAGNGSTRMDSGSIPVTFIRDCGLRILADSGLTAIEDRRLGED